MYFAWAFHGVFSNVKWVLMIQRGSLILSTVWLLATVEEAEEDNDNDKLFTTSAPTSSKWGEILSSYLAEGRCFYPGARSVIKSARRGNLDLPPPTLTGCP